MASVIADAVPIASRMPNPDRDDCCRIVDCVYVGSAASASKWPDAILCLTGEAASCDARIRCVPMLDLPTVNILHHLPTALSIIECARTSAARQRILVHCQHGHSRAPSFVIAWLMWRYRISLERAYAIVITARPSISINPGFLWQLGLWEWLLQASAGGGGHVGPADDDAGSSSIRALLEAGASPHAVYRLFAACAARVSAGYESAGFDVGGHTSVYTTSDRRGLFVAAASATGTSNGTTGAAAGHANDPSPLESISLEVGAGVAGIDPGRSDDSSRAGSVASDQQLLRYLLDGHDDSSTSESASTGAPSAPTRLTYHCGRCNSVLFTDHNLIRSNAPNSNAPSSASAVDIHIEPMAWMVASSAHEPDRGAAAAAVPGRTRWRSYATVPSTEDSVTWASSGDSSGRLVCPHTGCGHKLGSWDWLGGGAASREEGSSGTGHHRRMRGSEAAGSSSSNSPPASPLLLSSFLYPHFSILADRVVARGAAMMPTAPVRPTLDGTR